MVEEGRGQLKTAMQTMLHKASDKRSFLSPE